MKNSKIKPSILITGASGNVGTATVNELKKLNTPFVIGSCNPRTEGSQEARRLDFADPASFDTALEGIQQVFLLRPPALANVKKYFHPFIDKCKQMGVDHLVFLSLQGSDKNSITPHHKIEKYIKKVKIPYTFIRPSFFMQNLTTTHLEEIKKGEICVPAGNGKTNFIDTRDIGAVVAKVLVEKHAHINKAYEITGTKSYSYGQIAKILTKHTGINITYKSQNPIEFLYSKVRSGTKLEFAVVMLALYSVARIGKADHKTNDFEKLMDRKPISFNQFVEDNLELFRT